MIAVDPVANMGVLERPPDHVGQVDFSNKRRAQEYAEPPTGA